jgi:hypothetical protein
MKKGISGSLMEVFSSLTLIAFIIIAIYVWRGSYFDIAILVQSEEEQRRIITLGQILLSSSHLVNTEDDRAIRGVMDSTKLDSLVTDSQVLYQEIGYPNSTFKFTIKDKTNNNVWPISSGQINADAQYDRNFPLTIQYPDGQINPGEMELTYYVNPH